MASRTVTTLASNQDETRRKVLRLQNRAKSQFCEAAENIKEKVEQLDEDELDDFVNSNFDELNQTFLRESNAMRADVLKKKPKKPKREDFGSVAEYNAAQATYERKSSEFKEFVVWTTTVVQKLISWIGDLFTAIKNFFRDLWKWIKDKFKAIAQKVREFIEFVGQKISGLFDYIFG